MKDREKTKEQLIEELTELRQRVGELKVTGTEHKQAEEALKKERDMAQNYLDIAGCIILALDVDGKVTLMNKKGCETFGYDEEEVIGKDWFQTFLPERVREEVKVVFKRIMNGKIKKLEDVDDFSAITKSGKEISLLWHNTVITDEKNNIIGTLSLGEDITKRRQAESLLSIQRALATALNATPSLDEGLRLCVEAALQASEMDCGGVYLVDDSSGDLHLTFHQGLPAEFVRSASHYDANSGNVRVIMAGMPIYTQHQSLNTPMDEPRRQEGLRAIAIVPIRYQGRVIACINVASHTLDEVPVASRSALEAIAGQIGSAVSRLKAEEALRESEEQKRSILDNSTTVIYLKDVQGKYLFINSRYEELFHILRDEIVGKTDRDIFPLQIADDLQANDRKVLDRGKVVEFEEEVPQPGGDVRTYISVKFPLRNSEGIIYGICGISTDITQRKQMEEELIRTQRLRAVGELSAGVSHNLNNILTGILLPAQLLKLTTDDPKIHQEVDEILTYGQRAKDLVHRLHLSVRGIEEDTLLPVAVNEVISEAVRTSRPRWKDETESRGITVETVTALNEVPPIRGTRSRLHDILTNFIFNAVDAMPEGGMITINTQLADDRVQLTFTDTGVGMDEETRMRVFEPFFTTKMDIGTGLGLSTAYNTVKQWGGDIQVESSLGQGTTFTVQFPVWKQESIEKPTKREEHPLHPGKVLIIDDDPGICSMLTRLLERDHDVETMTNSRQALEEFVPGYYDAVLIDLGMSGMSGDRLAREIRRRDPLVSTVLITGWELSEDDPRREPFDFQLTKPFDDLDEISGVVAQAIDLHRE